MVVERETVFNFALDARRVGSVRELSREAGVILPVGKIGDDCAEDRAHKDILPVVAVVHCTRNSYKSCSGKRPKRDPCFAGMPSSVEKVQFTCKVKRQEAQASKREARVSRWEAPKPVI